MKSYGLQLRTRRNPKRYSYSKSFGSTTQLSDCNFDRSLDNANQNIPNPITGDPALPNACTACSRSDNASNEDGILYSYDFNYQNSCLLDNVPVGSPVTLQSAFDSARIYGLKAVGETTTGQALAHRRGPYAEVHTNLGQDYFDAMWSALQTAQKPLSVGTVWFPEMTDAGIIDMVQFRPTTDGHCWEVVGVKTTTAPRFIVKAWTGNYYYFGRAAVNTLMGAPGSDCLIDIDGMATQQDLKSIGYITILRIALLSFLQRLLAIVNNSPNNQVLATQSSTNSSNSTSMDPDSYMYPWDTPEHNYHNVRVLCDLGGLTLEQKNILCECIYQESGFYNYEPDSAPVQFHNKDKTGVTWSTDWGICQVNDYFNTGTGKPFPSIDYVMQNPDKVVEWMVNIYKTTGGLQPWSSYTSGAYKKWGAENSPMWRLML